jgi:1,4-alpha-glucan branching enzyme
VSVCVFSSRALQRRAPKKVPVIGPLLAVAFLASLPAPVPAQSARPGMGAIPYASGGATGVTFRVWAPNAATVSVPGSFNGWNTTANFLVKEGPSGLWSADIPAARNGSEYKYFINGSIWKRDPRDRKTVNSAGNSIVYDPAAFAWGGDTRLSVSASNLVIYELHVGAFYDPTPGSGGPGKFTDAITKLDYLAALGVNAIELMPVAEFPGDYSWGYNPADPYAVENTGYGGPDGLKVFVKAAHARGLRVLLDVVHNHYGPSDLDMYTFDVGNSPGIYFYTASNICCTPWGSRPNYASDGVRSYIIDNFRMWMDESHIDGFRWDSVGTMRHYDPGYVSIPEADTLIQYINSTTIHSDHLGAFSIAEDNSSGMNFDSEWNSGFNSYLLGLVSNSSDSARDMVGLQGQMNGTGFGRVIYTETHDLVGSMNGSGAQRVPTRIQPADPTGFYARKRSMLAAAVVMASPGIPMLFMGQEMLQTAQFSDSTPMDWSRTNTFAGILTFYRDLIRQRRNLDGVSFGLTGPNISWHVVDNTAKVLACHRWGAGPNDQVMVIFNFSNNALTNYPVSGFPADGMWFVNVNSDWQVYSPDFANFGSWLVPVTGGNGTVSIGRYSVLFLSRSARPDIDSDQDGLLNGWEQRYFGDPLIASPTDDPDGDGMDNLHEQAADTNPLLASSVLKFLSIQPAGTNLALNWIGGSAAKQLVEWAASPAGPWTAIFTNQPPTPITNSLVVPGASGASFFRIDIVK